MLHRPTLSPSNARVTPAAILFACRTRWLDREIDHHRRQAIYCASKWRREYRAAGVHPECLPSWRDAIRHHRVMRLEYIAERPGLVLREAA